MKVGIRGKEPHAFFELFGGRSPKSTDSESLRFLFPVTSWFGGLTLRLTGCPGAIGFKSGK